MESSLLLQQQLLIAGMSELAFAAAVCVLWVSEGPCMCELSIHADTDTFGNLLQARVQLGRLQLLPREARTMPR